MTAQRFNGRLFGPGLPGGGLPAAGCWEGEGRLLVVPDGTGYDELRAEQPTVSAAGFNAAGLRITWRQAAGDFAFVVENDDDRARCCATAPPAHREHLAAAAGTSRRLARRFRLGGLLLALLLALPLAGVTLALLHSDRAADWVVARIPVSQEQRLGELALAQVRLQMKLVDSGPAVEAIAAIGDRLTPGSAYRYRWFVAERPEINAFAAPGGVVVVFSGLLASVSSAEELAGVLAHEVAHAELRHSLRGMVKSLGLRALAGLALGNASEGALAGAATHLTELRFSRDAEREADANGLQRLVAARIDPRGMVRFYERLAAEQRPTPPALLSTHPATGERLERLRREVASLAGPWQALPVDLNSARSGLR